jgi:hypothetical protein
MEHVTIELLAVRQPISWLPVWVPHSIDFPFKTTVMLKLPIFCFVIRLYFPAKEFKNYHLGLNPKLKVSNSIPLEETEIPDVQLPEEFNWRDHNVDTEVKNRVMSSFTIYEAYW